MRTSSPVCILNPFRSCRHVSVDGSIEQTKGEKINEKKVIQ